MTSSAAHDPLIGQNVGGYLVEQPLGEGGMGLVYRARHPILNRSFAVKVLRPEVAADAAVASNFVREAQTLCALKHPHIIEIIGFGPLDDRRQFMVMEFLEGRTLEDELKAVGRLGLERALGLADQILDALCAAHSVEIVHRDLKPSNVFLARVSGGTELVKLLDFGLARQQPQPLLEGPAAPVAASLVAGTPEYVAPEQALGKPANKHSDLYSFGVMLFEMLTGGPPFVATDASGDRVRALISLHLHQVAPALCGANDASFPDDLEQLVAQLLKKEPSERPSSAQTVRSRLQRVQRGLQLQATQLRRSPLLLTRVASANGLELPDAGLRRPPRSLLGWSLLALIPLLAVGLWWLRSEPGADPVAPTPAAAPTPALPAQPKTAVASPVPPAPEPDPLFPRSPGEHLEIASPVPPAREPDLLAPLVKRSSRPRSLPAPPEPRPVALAPAPVAIVESRCEPNERWRQAARAHLQQLQQAAAASPDPKAWGRFEDAEPGLSGSIARAVTGADCDAVQHDIQQLAGQFPP